MSSTKQMKLENEEHNATPRCKQRMKYPKRKPKQKCNPKQKTQFNSKQKKKFTMENESAQQERIEKRK